MTREDIIRMAKECGNWSGQTIEMNDVGLERFANLLRAAIEQAPWVKSYAGGKPNYTTPEEQPGVKLDASAPLVVQPHPAFKKWQGLTEAEKVNVAIDCGCADVAWMDFADAIEAKLKEKNT